MEDGSEGDNSSRPALEEQSQSKDPQPKEKTQSELKKPARVKRVVTRVSKAGIQKAKEIGLAQLLSKEELGKRAKDNELESEPETETEEAPKGKIRGKKARRPHTLLSKEEIQRIFRRDDGLKNGKDPLPPGFVSTEKNKQKAFREMLASIPVAEQAEARGDISILNEATQTFNPSARSDGQGKWKVRGLVTSLMVNQVCVHFYIDFNQINGWRLEQVLAASWMVSSDFFLWTSNLLIDIVQTGDFFEQAEWWFTLWCDGLWQDPVDTG